MTMLARALTTREAIVRGSIIARGTSLAVISCGVIKAIIAMASGIAIVAPVPAGTFLTIGTVAAFSASAGSAHGISGIVVGIKN